MSSSKVFQAFTILFENTLARTFNLDRCFFVELKTVVVTFLYGDSSLGHG